MTDIVVILALVGVAAWARAGALGPSSLWLDDAWVALVARADGAAEVARISFTAPGYAFGLWGWLGLVGFSEVAAQLPAYLLGVAGPPALYVVARRMRLARPAAALAATVLLASPAHVLMSARVKHFTLDAALAVLLLWLGWRVVDRSGRVGWGALAVTAGAATAFSAVSAVVAVAALGAGIVAGWRGGPDPGAGAARLRVRGAGWVAAYGAFGLGWWLAVVRPAVTPALRSYWQDFYLDTGGVAALVASLGQGLRGVLEATAPLPWPVTAVVLLGALAVVATRRPALAVMGAGPVAIAVVLAAGRLAPLGGNRTDTYLVPGLALLVGTGAALAADRIVAGGLRRSELPVAGRSRRWARRGSGALAAVAAGLVLVAAGPRPDYPAEDVAPLVRAVESQAAPGEPILVYPSSRFAYALYTGHDVDIVDDPGSSFGFALRVDAADVVVLPVARDDPQRYTAPVAAATAGHARVWLVVSHAGDDLAALRGVLGGLGFEAVEVQRRDGALLVRWERTGGA